MNLCKMLLIAAMAILIVSSPATARDFGWTRNFNLQAKADPFEFRARLAARFDLSDIQVMALRNIFASPADAYIMLRLGEIQGVLKKLSKEEGIEAVQKYRSNRCKGWDMVAASLGVAPGSEEFLALKRDHDLHDGNTSDQVAYSGYERGH